MVSLSPLRPRSENGTRAGGGVVGSASVSARAENAVWGRRKRFAPGRFSVRGPQIVKIVVEQGVQFAGLIRVLIRHIMELERIGAAVEQQVAVRHLGRTGRGAGPLIRAVQGGVGLVALFDVGQALLSGGGLHFLAPFFQSLELAFKHAFAARGVDVAVVDVAAVKFQSHEPFGLVVVPGPMDVGPVFGKNGLGIWIVARDGEIAHFVHLAARQGQQAFALHVGMHADAQPLAHGGRDIHALHKALDPLTRRQPGSAQHHDGVHQFLIGPGAALAHDAMTVLAVAHGFAVVGHDKNQGIPFQTEAAELIQKVAELTVDHGDLFGVEHTHMVQFFLGVDAFHRAHDRQELILALEIGIIRAFHIRVVD